MGYTIELRQNNLPVQIERHEEGGTYVVGGTTDAVLHITSNYAKHFREVLPTTGLRWLYGKKASDCVSQLHSAVRQLGTVQDKDYWAATPGNAGYALSILLKWAKQHPDAVFEGD